MSWNGRTNHGRGHLRQRENESNQMTESSVHGNPVALMSRMEMELNEIRRLAISRGRRYQSAIRRLDCLEEALLAMFEVRLQLMENIILRPRFAAASNSLLIATPPAGSRRLPAMLGVRDLEENLYFLKNRVRVLQRRVNSFGPPGQGPGPSNTENERPREIGYAEIIKRELEKIIGKEEEKGSRTEFGHSTENQICQAPINPSNALAIITNTRQHPRRSVPNKRSKFTC